MAANPGQDGQAQREDLVEVAFVARGQDGLDGRAVVLGLILRRLAAERKLPEPVTAILKEACLMS